MREDWVECQFGDLLNYEQPTNYIVKSTKYNDNYKTPVLTAGKTFIKGYTNETDGIFTNLPTIIFDDFTTASRLVDFEFKVKSSAMKILLPTSKLVNLKFVFHCMQVNKVRSDTHKRYWISVFAKNKLLLPPLPIQRATVTKIENLFISLDKGIADLKKAQEQLKVYRQAALKKAFEGKGKLNRLGELAEIVGGVTKGRKLDASKTIKLPYLRVANVQDGFLNLETIKYIEVLPTDIERYRLLNEDVLFTEGGDRDKLGRGTVWKMKLLIVFIKIISFEPES